MKNKKHPWSSTEDEVMISLIKQHGTKNWGEIARLHNEHIKPQNPRTGKQCGEGYHNHLNPTINKNPISEEEEEIIMEQHKLFGHKWAEIARFIPGK